MKASETLYQEGNMGKIEDLFGP